MTRLSGVGIVLLACGLPAAAAERGPVEGLNHFSDSLYRHAAKGGGNLVLSPYSISAALSMALAGARGDTAAEMRQVLGTGGDGFGALIDGILKAANTNGNQLAAANSLWVQKGFSILPEFTQRLASEYHAAPAQVDFEGDVEGARGEINAWTDRETRGKIKDLFAPGAIKSNTRLILGSAVYFNGKWEKAFRKADTQPAPFTTGSGASEQVPFMHRAGSFGYAETAGGQTLEIRYAGTGLAFDILLPKKGEKLDAAEADIPGWLGGLHDRDVQVYIPRFRVAYETELAKALESMGMRKAFTGAADFSGIDDKRDLRLAQVVHKAWIDVTEEGTEAAAATGATMALVSMRMPTETVFRADRPFLFLIRDRKSGLILFAGRLMNPKL
jgi:serpin B